MTRLRELDLTVRSCWALGSRDSSAAQRVCCGERLTAADRAFVDLHADNAGNAGLTHCDAIQCVYRLHRLSDVSDDDKLRTCGHGADRVVVAAHVCLVEWCVNLVQNAERRRLVLEDRED